MISNEERKAFLAKLKEEGIFYIIDADEKYRDDKIIMKGLVKVNGGLLAVASDRLKKDEEIIKEALSSKNDHLGTSNGKPYGFAIEHVDKEYLKNHPDLILEFLDKNMENASILGKELLFEVKEVYEYVLNNIHRNTFLWNFIPNEKDKYSKSVVMKVINDMPNMISDLPVALQCDVDIVKEAARDHHPDFNSVYAMYGCMNEEAQKNPDVCRILMDIDPRVFPILRYRDDYIIRKGLAYQGDYLGILKNEKSIKEYVLIAVSQNGLALDCADSKFRDDDDVVYAAISNNGWAINLASKRLSENPKMINKALDVSPELATYGWKRPTNNKR